MADLPADQTIMSGHKIVAGVHRRQYRLKLVAGGNAFQVLQQLDRPAGCQRVLFFRAQILISFPVNQLRQYFAAGCMEFKANRSVFPDQFAFLSRELFQLAGAGLLQAVLPGRVAD